MNKDNRSEVSHCLTAKEIWTAITSVYENKFRRVASTLWKKLWNYKMTSVRQIDDGISELLSIVAELRARKITVEETCTISTIESSLPPEFQNWLVRWSMRDSEPTLNELINSINNHAQSLESLGNQQVFLASANKTNTRFRTSKSCNYCRKDGHLVNECRKLKKKEEEEARANKNSKATDVQANPSHALLQDKSFAIMATTEKNLPKSI